MRATYSPPGVYQPDYWTIGAHDLKNAFRVGNSTIATNTAWIANLAVYVPVVIDVPCTVYEWWLYNGTLTTAHNIDFGIYNMDFTKVASTGTQVGATTASAIINTSGTTDVTLAPGSYYMAFASDSTRNYTTSSDPVGTSQAYGVMEQTTAFVLPSPAVPVTYTRAFVPHFGMNLRTTAV